MAHFCIDTENGFGVPLPDLHRLSNRVGTHRHLAIALLQSGFHEAPLLASMIAKPAETERMLAAPGAPPIAAKNTKTGRWIALRALRELEG